MPTRACWWIVDFDIEVAAIVGAIEIDCGFGFGFGFVCVCGCDCAAGNYYIINAKPQNECERCKSLADNGPTT